MSGCEENERTMLLNRQKQSYAYNEVVKSTRTASTTTSATTTSSTATAKITTNIPRLCCAFLSSMTVGGTTYAFGLYGSALKKSLHLSQSQLDTISTANFCAGLLAWIPGLCVDRFGTQFSLGLGGMLGASSLMLYWVVAKSILPIEDKDMIVCVLSLLGISAFLSGSLVTGSVFKIIVANCGPGSKGTAVGIAKGYVGLGVGTYACIFEALRLPEMSKLDFLPMAAFFFIVAATIPSLCLLPKGKSPTQLLTHEEEEQQKVRQEFPSVSLVRDATTPLHFKLLYGSLIAVATIVVNTSLRTLHNKNLKDDANKQQNFGLAFLLLSVWMGPILSLLLLPQKPWITGGGVAAKFGGEEIALLEDHDEENIRLEHMESSFSSTTSSEEANSNIMSIETSNHGTDKNLIEMLRTPSAILMLWTMTILVGGGTVETTNMGQMVESLGFPESVTPPSLALFSVAQGTSRVVTGAISEAAAAWNTRHCMIDNGVPRPFFLVVASVLSFVAHLILAYTANQATFIIGIALCGVTFGMVWPLMVLIVGEVFGKTNYGANYMFFDGFTLATGTLVLTKIIAQRVYEHHINEIDSDGVTCYGIGCFQNSHVVIVVLSLTCVFTSVALVFTTRHAYNKKTI